MIHARFDYDAIQPFPTKRPPVDGQSEVQRCQVCERPNPPWFADSRLWNEVMGPDHDRDREAGGFLCPSCFADAADVYFDTTEWEVTGWQMIPELRRR